ncbi:RsmB/NOP family class I SAM-dependent RNA methyltransferase [Nitratiruptor sp. YY09-18]|uniref:RsmB/NOP family class I SAM-dependent RNA methyltransferase n=1 Tax=Nitratiruptor sp. YY09-18 TaxID=2724901 RepID=UPI001914FA3F|nr:RsmB/NOP family class I SAM-dependent RNA methyltransferase [Nitratiruptor sp. YY09-18]BCD68330.1 hypothetical protein NitYY0918_C1241 [Nitratiruptor sp. YY09-18]
MHQQLFEERIKKINPDILQALQSKDSFSFRINHHRATTDEAIQLLQEEGYEPEIIAWAQDVFVLPMSERKKITKSRAYTQNMIYIQNLSSIFAAYSLDIEPEDWVLDLAAAPGGKSLIFSERAKKVSAVEPDKGRFFRMKRNFKEHMAKNIQTYNKDGRFIYKSCPAWFDKVFLDAPCSSEAHIDGEVTWWNMRRVRKFAKLQKELIISAFESLKPSGQMIYATCTFAPEENEAVVNFLLSRYPEARVVPVEAPFPNKMAGIPEWEGEKFHPDVAKTLRILPQDAYSGFYLAKIVKS